MGTHVNIEGYTLRKIGNQPYLWLFERALYDFRITSIQPLTYDDGTRLIRPDAHFVTDMGSIPLFLQPIFPKDGFLLSYIFHDSCYKHHGIYVRDPVSDAKWRFVTQTRRQADEMLWRMIGVEGGPIAKWIVWLGVRVGGGRPWASGYETEARRQKTGGRHAGETTTAPRP